MILSGKEVSLSIYEDIKQKISALHSKPKLGVILVGNNPVSLKYIAQKQKWAQYVGMDFELYHLKEDTSFDDVKETLFSLNQDSNLHGYIIQLPLPKHLDEKKIIPFIDPKKDVDGFHPENQGKLVIGDTNGLGACTPLGVMEMLKYYNIPLLGKKVVLLGRSNIVGKPLANLLINAGTTLTLCNSSTPNTKIHTKDADIVILAIGKTCYLKKEDIAPHTIVIDVGFSIIDGKITGDADFENILQNGNSITPVPGGVGLMTVAMLIKNTFLAYSKQKNGTL